MKTGVFYGVIYFKDGRIVETGTFTGPGAEISCERYTLQQYEQYVKTAINPFFEPSRYIVKEK